MPAADKVDLYKAFKDEYVARRKPSIVEVTSAQYLSVTGSGAPGSERFTQAIGGLYTVAFTTKMQSKFAGRDYTVCKLEALWWTGRNNGDLTSKPPNQWKWQLLIRTPDFIEPSTIEGAIALLREKGKPEEVTWVSLQRIEEGRCVQMLHVGPYDQEQDTLDVMSEYAASQGLQTYGRHHEVYLSDPRRVAPSRLRTILRRPVRD